MTLSRSSGTRRRVGIADRLRPVLVVFLLVFGCEFAVMMVLPALGIPEGLWEATVDSALLSVSVVSCLGLLGLIRPDRDVRETDGGTSDSPASRGRVLSLRNQFVAILTALAIGPVLWVGWTVEHGISASMVEEASASARLLLRRDAQVLGMYLQELREDVSAISHYPPTRGLLRSRAAGGVDPADGSTTEQWVERLETLYLSYASTHAGVVDVRFIDARGHEWLHVRNEDGASHVVPPSALRDDSGRPWFAATATLPDGRCHVSSFDRNEERGTAQAPCDPLIRVAAPVHFEGAVRGVVVVGVSPQAYMAELAHGEMDDLLLADREGEFLYDPDEAQRASARNGEANVFHDWPALHDALRAGRDLTTRGDRLLFVTRVPFNGDGSHDAWLLARRWDADVLFGASARLKEVTTSAMIGVGTIALVIALFMASRWSSPVTRLAEAADRVRRGDYTVRLPTTRRDELGDTARAFNRMAEAMAKHTEQLESAVRRRTLELETQKSALDEHAIVSITDIEGDITYANDKFCEINGYSRAELIGRNHRIVKSDEHAPEFFRDLWLTISHGRVWRGEIKNLRKDGTHYWVAATIVPLKNELGKITQYVAIRTDVTERIEAEQRVRAYADELEGQKEEAQAINAELNALNLHLEEARAIAESATRAKSAFLANMSHEIRTPMTAILGFAENLLEPGLPESERQDAARTIHRNGEYLIGIINDILDLSKIEAGKMAMERVPCRVCAIVAEVFSLVKVRADGKGLAFNVEYIGAVPETIETDPTRLRQVLINLLGNAIKFTEEGGVRLICRLVADDAMPRMQFDVLDTGVGMTDAQVANLFQPFTQADSSTTRRFGGTGLGLTITKRFVEMLGGEVTVVDSQAGVGTRFRVTIATGPLDGVRMLDDPARAADQGDIGTTPSRPAANDPLAGRRILLAEDGPDNQRLIAHFLKKAGADVTVCENGRLAADEALAAQARNRAFDVILMDMQMPVMDGYAATKLLRAEGYDAPIVALTANAMADDRRKCIEAGCNDFATKPINRKTLIEAIQAQSTTEATVA